MPTGPDDRPGGFIVLHRRIESWPLWQAMKGEHRMVWVTLLLAANWKNSEVWTRKGRLIVQRGQALVAQRALAQRAGATRQNVRTAIDLLTSEGAIQVTQVPVRGAKTASLITIVNYEKYQAVEEREDFDAPSSQPKSNPIRTRGTTCFTPPPQNLNTVPPFDTRAGSRLEVVKLNPDDVLSDWDHEQQRDVPRGLTTHGRERLRKGRP